MRKKSVLTEKQAALVEALCDGDNLNTAAKKAGYSGPTGAAYAVKVPDVQAKIAENRAMLQDASTLKRVDVLNGFLEAIEAAKTGSDPGSMIRGWSEIGKMLGLYAPEVKKIQLSGSQERISNEFDAMSDPELLSVIEGDFHRVG